eukprot:gene7368-1213_t
MGCSALAFVFLACSYFLFRDSARLSDSVRNYSDLARRHPELAF